MKSGNISKKIAYDEWLNWLNTRYPGSKNKILSQVMSRTRLGAAGDEAVVAEPEWYEQVITAASAIIPTYYNYKLQSKLVDAQISRARAGQAPLDEQYFKSSANIGPTIKHQIDTGISDDTKNILVFGGLGLAAFYLLSNAKSI